MPITAFAATRYVYYQGSLSDQVLVQILKKIFPCDDLKIIRPQPDPQPEPEPVPQEPQPDPQEPQPEPQEPQPEPQEPQPEPQPEPQEPQKPEPQPQPQPQPEEPGSDVVALTQDEQKMINLVNQERQKYGMKPLKVDYQLVKLARMKSQDMVDKNYFSHQSPTYGSPFDMMKNAGVSYRWAGENIAGAGTVERAHNALMNSEGHRANILNPNFTHIGVGIVMGGPYGMMFTQMFIGK
ncbi:MAG: hypothetical protein GX480_06275 [Syntrophomonadaceae bacterium]|nr:hypothetical protein [Syntrophomonadaceae bacterium]